MEDKKQPMLARGERMVEILKQAQYAPIPVEKQICIIFAATNKYLDELPVSRAYVHLFKPM